MPKYKLTWSGQLDTPALRAATEHLKVFPLFNDSKAKLINHEEYTQLVTAKEITKPKSYWQIEKDEVGLISLVSFSRYIDTWGRISTAKGDFEAGWKACKKHNENN